MVGWYGIIETILTSTTGISLVVILLFENVAVALVWSNTNIREEMYKYVCKGSMFVHYLLCK